MGPRGLKIPSTWPDRVPLILSAQELGEIDGRGDATWSYSRIMDCEIARGSTFKLKVGAEKIRYGSGEDWVAEN